MSAVTRDGEPWFVAADVCKALEIDPTATRRLDDDEKAALRLTQTSSNGVEQGRDTTIINEPGLYSLVLGSRKPEDERPQEVSKMGVKVPSEIILDTVFDTLKI